MICSQVTSIVIDLFSCLEFSWISEIAGLNRGVSTGMSSIR